VISPPSFFLFPLSSFSQRTKGQPNVLRNRSCSLFFFFFPLFCVFSFFDTFDQTDYYGGPLALTLCFPFFFFFFCLFFLRRHETQGKWRAMFFFFFLPSSCLLFPLFTFRSPRRSGPLPLPFFFSFPPRAERKKSETSPFLFFFPFFSVFFSLARTAHQTWSFFFPPPFFFFSPTFFSQSLSAEN